MQNVGVPAFNMGDLIRPTADRVIGILSGLINFTRFREEKLNAFNECLQQTVFFILLFIYLILVGTIE